MAINKKLISFATQVQFDNQLSAGNIDNRSIVFIEDEKRIWTHGVYFDTSWDYIQNKPSTLDEYGITDVVTINTAQTITGVKTFTGNVTAPTFVGELTGNASSATTSNILGVLDIRNIAITPVDIPNGSVTAFLNTNAIVNAPPVTTGSTYAHILNMNGWQSGNNEGGGHTTQLAFGDSLAIRQSTSSTAWGAWTRLALVTDNVASATKVSNQLILKFDTGTTENTNLYTYDGSAAKTIDIKAGSNVSFTKTGSTVTINSTDTNTVYTHPSYTAYASGLYKITTNTLGHVTGATAVVKSDITTLGIPGQDTTYSTGTLSELNTGTNTTGKLQTAKNLNDWLNGKGYITSYVNTTYTAGSGLTLSGTQFSLPVTVSGSGTYVQSVAQNTNGISVTLGTPPNTTYSAMSVSEGQAGTATSLRTMRADYLKQIIQYYDTNSISGIRAGASGTSTNAEVTSPYIKVLDDGIYREQIRLVGGGATTVSSDASGNVTISSTNTTYDVATTSTNGLMSDTDKTNLNFNTSARHSHTNKATLDKITEVGEELKYNGETVVTKTSFTWARLKGAMSWAELIGM